MKKIGIIGNPNTGKTTIFNKLTFSHAKTGNWHGVTVGEELASLKYNNLVVELVDLPGTYSLKNYSMEEKVVANFVDKKDYEFVLSIVDANNLERSINLSLELLARGVKIILVVNMIDELEKNGGNIDEIGISKKLNIPVIKINAHCNEDINRLKTFIFKSLNNNFYLSKKEFSYQEIFNFYKKGIVKKSKLDKIFLNNFLALPVFFLFMGLVFFITFGKNMLGEFLKNGIDMLIGKKFYNSVFNFLIKVNCPTFFKGLICDAIIKGAGSLLSFIPQISLLYIFLNFMEESGYMSRLAFISDGFFEKIGLTGRAVFSLLMGFGCTTAAILTTRGYENKSLQKRAIFTLPFISCSAKLPVYLVLIGGFFEENKFLAIFAIYLIGILLSLFSAFLLKFFIIEREEFIMELAPYRLPPIKLLLNSLIFYIKQFIIKIGKIVMAFLILMWLVMSFSLKLKYVGNNINESILANLCYYLKYLFYPINIESLEISIAMLSGIVAKETIAGMISLMFPNGIVGLFTLSQVIALIMFVMIYTPCISAISGEAKELGKKTAILHSLFQFVLALLLCYLSYFICELIITFGYIIILCGLAFAILIVFSYFSIKKINCKGCSSCNERIYCKRRHKSK